MVESRYDAELDPEQDLKGATPETLARALLLSKRRLKGASRVREAPVDGYEPGRGADPELDANDRRSR